MFGNGDVADEVLNVLALADQPMAVARDEYLGGLEAAVVLIAHRVAIGARVLDDDDVAEL